jgi:TolB-like protein
MGLLGELQRRNVFRAIVAYGVFSWVVIQVIDIVGPEFSLPDETLRYTLLLLAMFLPVFLLLTWSFKWTPDGLVRHSIEEQQPVNFSAKWINTAIVSLLIIALVLVVLDAYVLVDEESNPFDSIAVLPFEDMSSNKDQEYFSHGLSEELLNLLARIDGLKVAARTSSFAFKGQNQDIREIGKMLGVVTVLEGSVRQSGDRIRVTAQLINVENGYHLWSDNFDRELTDIFEIQDEIATSIVSALKLHLDTDESPVLSSSTTDNVAAYDDYLKGLDKEKQGEFRDALDFFREATNKDPRFAKAWAGRARLVVQMRETPFWGEIPRNEVELLATTALERALSLAPNLPEALIAQGIYDVDNYRYELAKANFQKALETNPNNVHALMGLGDLQERTGHLQESFANLEKALDLDPKNWVLARTAYNIASSHNNLSLLDKAISLIPTENRDFLALLRVSDLGPQTAENYERIMASPYTRMQLGVQQSWLGELSYDAIVKASAAYPDDFYLWELIYGGRFEEAIKVYENLVPVRQTNTLNLEEMSVLYTAMGKCEKALDLLKEAHGENIRVYGSINVNAPRSNLNLALNRVHCLRKLDRAEEAQPIIEIARHYIDTLRANGDCCYATVDAKLRYLDGDIAGAISTLAKGFELNRVIYNREYRPFYLQYHPVFSELKGNPTFDVLMLKTLESTNSLRSELGLDPLVLE